MKLLKLRHDKCDEYQGTTFVFCPDDWCEDEIERKLNEARDEYLDALRDIKELAKKKPYPETHDDGTPDLKNYPSDWTIAQVNEHHIRRQEANKTYEATLNKGYAQYESYLKNKGFVPLWDDEAPVDEYEIYWGHNHGLGINWAEEETDTLPSPRKLAGRSGSFEGGRLIFAGDDDD